MPRAPNRYATQRALHGFGCKHPSPPRHKISPPPLAGEGHRTKLRPRRQVPAMSLRPTLASPATIFRVKVTDTCTEAGIPRRQNGQLESETPACSRTKSIELSLSLTNARLDDTILPVIAAMDSLHLDYDPMGRVGSIHRDLLPSAWQLLRQVDRTIDIHSFCGIDNGVNLLPSTAQQQVRWIFLHIFPSDMNPTGMARIQSASEADPRIQPAISAMDLLDHSVMPDPVRLRWASKLLLVTPSTRIEPATRAAKTLRAISRITKSLENIKITVDRGVDLHFLDSLHHPLIERLVIGSFITKSDNPTSTIKNIRKRQVHESGP